MRRYGALKERIKLKYGNQKAFAEALGMNLSTLNLKLNSKADWTASEIEKTSTLLGITLDEVVSYFFYS